MEVERRMMRNMRMMPMGRMAGGRPAQGGTSLNATQLYCPTCKQAMPVREHVALYLPSGAIYHYRCMRCNTMLGKKQD